jgi:folate-binding protein YgfZ
MHEDVLRDSQRLPHLGTVLLSGPDTRTFLQGQISTDVRKLTADAVLLTSCNSPQGRVQAVLWLLERGEEILLVTSAELIEHTAARLKKYVLRAKVSIEPHAMAVFGRMESAVAAVPWTAPLPQRFQDTVNVIQWPGGRQLLVAPAGETQADETFVRAWQLADIRNGIPTVHTQTHERFVAQMLNLDLLGGVSFDKGCYTGQEIIARTHFRGTVKRRMLRYEVAGTVPPPGARIVAGEEPAGEVATSCATANGSELLAVIQLSHIERELHVDGTQAVLKPLPLPYSVD